MPKPASPAAPPPTTPCRCVASPITPRGRLERVTAARTRVEVATAQLEAALADMVAGLDGIRNPILEELRDTILAGKRILARSADIQRRITV